VGSNCVRGEDPLGEKKFSKGGKPRQSTVSFKPEHKMSGEMDYGKAKKKKVQLGQYGKKGQSPPISGTEEVNGQSLLKRGWEKSVGGF